MIIVSKRQTGHNLRGNVIKGKGNLGSIRQVFAIFYLFKLSIQIILFKVFLVLIVGIVFNRVKIFFCETKVSNSFDVLAKSLCEQCQFCLRQQIAIPFFLELVLLEVAFFFLVLHIQPYLNKCWNFKKVTLKSRSIYIIFNFCHAQHSFSYFFLERPKDWPLTG